MDEYGERLTKLAYNYLKDWNLAEDVVQDVFITCYHHFENMDTIVYFKSWIYKITINKCKDTLKSLYMKRVIHDSNLFRFFHAKELTPEMSLIYQSDEELLSISVLSLPIKYREVITLYYYEELSIEEISELLLLNKNTIKTRLNRGREKLKVIMERSEGNGGKANKFT
ncbi:sigma-70 family RNA polymerase sigma factor [Bacillus sp. RD4P76]|uniref:Sigma-70 family RNA polymerase sigma factor n=2 Tax=Bacillus suaedaesalsae TaxID=2810349 RepID=A0ABS2DHP8_9BACI|nr:sigma-70 family RNA polymerase sigma factor [Bacillus suaedaesalsae]